MDARGIDDFINERSLVHVMQIVYHEGVQGDDLVFVQVRIKSSSNGIVHD